MMARQFEGLVRLNLASQGAWASPSNRFVPGHVQARGLPVDRWASPRSIFFFFGPSVSPCFYRLQQPAFIFFILFFLRKKLSAQNY
jgi:hypothetical protein